jgi:hypothetical protein
MKSNEHSIKDNIKNLRSEAKKKSAIKSFEKLIPLENSTVLQ